MSFFDSCIFKRFIVEIVLKWLNIKQVQTHI